MQKSTSDSWSHIKPLQKGNPPLAVAHIWSLSSSSQPGVQRGFVSLLSILPRVGLCCERHGCNFTRGFLKKGQKCPSPVRSWRAWGPPTPFKHSPEGCLPTEPPLRNKPNLFGSPVPGPLGATCRVQPTTSPFSLLS